MFVDGKVFAEVEWGAAFTEGNVLIQLYLHYISGLLRLLIMNFSSFQLLEALCRSSCVCAFAQPCATAFVNHSRAWFSSLVTPRSYS